MIPLNIGRADVRSCVAKFVSKLQRNWKIKRDLPVS